MYNTESQFGPGKKKKKLFFCKGLQLEQLKCDNVREFAFRE